MEGKFLITADATTASALVKCGFQKMETGNKNIYTFLNNSSINFSFSFIRSHLPVPPVRYTPLKCNHPVDLKMVHSFPLILHPSGAGRSVCSRWISVLRPVPNVLTHTPHPYFPELQAP